VAQRGFGDVYQMAVICLLSRSRFACDGVQDSPPSLPFVPEESTTANAKGRWCRHSTQTKPDGHEGAQGHDTDFEQIADGTKAIQEHRDNDVQDYHHLLADITKNAADNAAYAV